MNVFVVCGSPAAGKTTYGAALARRLGAACVDIDACTERVVQAGLRLAQLDENDRDSPTFKAAMRDPIYEQLFDIAALQLHVGLSVVIVGPFTRELRNANWLEDLSARLAIAADRIEVHWVVCADDQVRFERMRQRNNPRDAAKLVDFAAFSRQYSVEPPLCPHTRVDT